MVYLKKLWYVSLKCIYIYHLSYICSVFYEQKQYKKGLSAAREVMKKFPNHGGKRYISEQNLN